MIFQEKINEHSLLLQKQKRKSTLIVYVRFFLFISMIVLIFLSKKIEVIYLISLLLLLMLLFLVFVQISYRMNLKIQFLENIISINRHEIDLLNYELSGIYTGKDYTDRHHKYAADLDLFGESSIFVFLNRSATVIGQNYLAQMLCTPCLEKHEIEMRQKAISELSKELDWRQGFQALGRQHLKTYNENKEKNDYKIEETNKKIVLNWLNEPFYFINNKNIRFFRWFLPSITIILLFLSIFKVISVQFFFLSGILQLVYLSFFIKKINKIHQKTNQSGEILNHYALLLNLIETKDFEAVKLNGLKQSLMKDKISASQSVKELKTILSALDQRMNFLIAFVSNFLFLSDLHLISRLERWQSNYKEKITDWLNVIKEYDVLSSFAGFAYANEDFVFPQVSDTDFIYDIKNAGHPSIPPNVRVCNDFKLMGWGSFAIVTGANMAGKSTFLRTTALQIILGMCGSKVCASSFEFTPIELFTSIRANDSLSKNESYFYAELKRLQSIIREIKTGKKLFVIVDEMLRGTNSNDKHYGSRAFILQLVKQNACGLIATHDIMLGKLEEEMNGKIINRCFEVEINQDKLLFDYKIKNGISKNLNASFLMRKMEIIDQ
jgi:DNA mismatch repair ATPase MutS